jgi:chromosome segregation ATPase
MKLIIATLGAACISQASAADAGTTFFDFNEMKTPPKDKQVSASKIDDTMDNLDDFLDMSNDDFFRTVQKTEP